MPNSDDPYLAILLYHTLSVLAIRQSNSKNSNRALFICKNTHNYVIKSENKLQISCARLSFFHQFLSFSYQKMRFIIKVSVDNLSKKTWAMIPLPYLQSASYEHPSQFVDEPPLYPPIHSFSFPLFSPLFHFR